MRAIVLLLAAALCCCSVRAQVPNLINYQGFLTTPGGTPVTASLVMEFRLYDVPSGGTAFYTETQTVSVDSGAFNALIGTSTPLPQGFNVPYWLGVKAGVDAEMTPRRPVAASPYALTAATLAPGGNLTLTHPSTAAAGNIMKGAHRFIHNFGAANTFVGESAGNFSMSGDLNTGTGAGTLASNTAGTWNTANGYNALAGNQDGSFNTAIGMQSLTTNVSGSNNTAIGVRALMNATGINNVALGANAGASLTTGNDNIAIGNPGAAVESATIRIGNGHSRTFVAGIRGVTTGVADAQPVGIDSANQLGKVTSIPGTLITGPIAAAGASSLSTYIGFGAAEAPPTGTQNTAYGAGALRFTTTGGANVAIGPYSLLVNVGGSGNVAVGRGALSDNSGSQNIGIGDNAGVNVTTGSSNILIGNVAVAGDTNTIRIGTGQSRTFVAGIRGVATGVADAEPVGIDSANQLGKVTSIPGTLIAGPIAATGAGIWSTYVGAGAGISVTNGNENSAFGEDALGSTTTGEANVAVGHNALYSNVSSGFNVAIGAGALSGTTGWSNIGIGRDSGSNLTTGDFNIAIGDRGVAGEAKTIRIGDHDWAPYNGAYIQGIHGATVGGAGQGVFVVASGKLGTLLSSRRYKEDIAPMDDASAGLMRLKPVTFRYKPEVDDAQRLLQYGLIAEEVADVLPDLVVRTPDGQPETVRYHYLAPMLVNEVQRQQRTIEAQTAEMNRQAARIAALESQASELAMLRRQMAELRAAVSAAGRSGAGAQVAAK